MAVGKYRQKHTWYDSKFWGAHEELLAEGISAGRSWSRSVQEKATAYSIERRDTVTVRIPEADSPAEMALKLVAKGWTGNPFGSSREFHNKV